MAAVLSLSGCLAPGVVVGSATPQDPPGPTTSAAPTASQEPTPTVVPNAAGKKTGPVGMNGRWKLAWSDEFSGRSVDLDKWRPNWLTNEDHWISKPINKAEKACYDPEHATVKSGTLRLKITKDACVTWDGRRYPNTAGQVESAHDFTFTYGFAEAKIYLPPSDGTQAPAGSCGPNWMVFMLNGKHHPEDGEIDVMECLSRNDVSWHYHYGTEADPHVDGGYPEKWQGTMPATQDGWHTFGVDWRPGQLDFYYDGVLVGTQSEAVTDAPHYLVLTHAVSGAEVAEQSAKVDWVRVWKRR